MRSPIETVQSIYAAFGRGDVPAILEHLAPDVEWEYAYKEAPTPWLAPGRGRDHVARFFGVLGTQVEITGFAVNHILAGDKVVVGLVNLEATVRATGIRVVETDEPHVWHFDAQGRVCKFRHAADTLQHHKALGR